MIIIGAGLSGLIAANMLRSNRVSVLEAQSSLPNNHSALLRFRSSVVGDAVGIPFRKVRVMKAIQPWRNPVADALAYSLKCTGSATLRSSVSAGGEVEERYIAPPDLSARLADNLRSGTLVCDVNVTMDDIQLWKEPVISTMPMPALMRLLGWETKQIFTSVPGYTVTVDIPEWMGVNACATVYLPNPEQVPYRVSLTERRLIIEVARHALPGTGWDDERHLSKGTPVADLIATALGVLGLDEWLSLSKLVERAKVSPMRYAKILPVDDDERKKFIMWASQTYKIHSLGRFATWRPGLLLDDIVNDVRVIQRIIDGDSTHRYAALKTA